MLIEVSRESRPTSEELSKENNMRLSVFILLVGLVGCQFELEAPILPNVDLRSKIPESVPPLGSSEVPKVPEAASAVIANLDWSDSLASDLGIEKKSHCAQLVKQPGGAVVKIFSASCPENLGLGAEAALRFSLAYSRKNAGSADEFVLWFDHVKTGEMSISPDGTRLNLFSLCTGAYAFDCHVPVKGSAIAGSPVLY